METLYKMPTMDRKFYIMKHNEIMNHGDTSHKSKDTRLVNGESINTYAKLEIERRQNEKRGV